MTIVLHDLILFGLIAMNIGIFIKTWRNNDRVDMLEDIILEFVEGLAERLED